MFILAFCEIHEELFAPKRLCFEWRDSAIEVQILETFADTVYDKIELFRITFNLDCLGFLITSDLKDLLISFCFKLYVPAKAKLNSNKCD